MFGVGSFQKWNRFGQGPYNIWHFKKHVLNGLKSFLLSIDRITHGTACNRLHGFRGTLNSKVTCRNSCKVGSEFCNKAHWIKFQPGSKKKIRNSIRKKSSVYLFSCHFSFGSGHLHQKNSVCAISFFQHCIKHDSASPHIPYLAKRNNSVAQIHCLSRR